LETRTEPYGALAVTDLYGNPWDLIEPSPDGASI
jgi:hypothetical protein